MEAKDFCQDWVKAPDLDTSGAFTEIRHCLRKPMPTQFQAINEELKNTIYDSYWNKPLGKTRDPTPGLPYGMKPEKITFGIRTKMGDPASLVVNPRKPSEYLEKEDRYFHDLYAFTHHNYYPGERINRE